jgi:hypothetical protein
MVKLKKDYYIIVHEKPSAMNAQDGLDLLRDYAKDRPVAFSPCKKEI